jgi:hypothetical protein
MVRSMARVFALKIEMNKIYSFALLAGKTTPPCGHPSLKRRGIALIVLCLSLSNSAIQKLYDFSSSH